MPTVSQIQMQAAVSPFSEAIAQPGSLAGGSAMPVGFDTFLSSLNQKMLARLDARTDSGKLSSPKTGLGTLGMQNLPGFTKQDKDSAKITDPMQLLAAQLAAQGLISPVVNQPTVSNPLLNSGLGVNAVDSSKTMAGLNLPSALGLKGQNIDSQQNQLITQSLARAMKEAGQGINLGAQNPQLAQLMQMLQQAQPTNTAQASALEQLKGLVAQAGQTNQTASPAPKITLTPELASAIRDLAQQAQPTNTAQASALEQLKGLVAQAGQTNQTASPAPKITLTPELASAIRDLAQQAQPTNTAQASALEQLKGLVAQAGQTNQTASPAPKITLTPELASAIRDLAQQAQPTNTAQASALEQLKGLVAQAGQTNQTASPAPKITLTPELASAIRDLAQQAQPTNTAQASALEQLKGLVAQAGQTNQTASPAPKITLTPELASAIRDLAQQAQPTNTAQASALEQLKGLVAQAGQTNQTASPAPKITLTPELASAIRDLAQQAQPTNTAQASALEQLKGLVAQAGQTNQTASPAPKITLTPELASAIRDLAQQAQPTNTAQASALEQLKGLVAQAGQTNQTASPAPKITLTPELASAIRDLAQQAQPTNTAQASALEQLKGLVAQAGQTNQTASPAPKITLTPELASAIRDLAQQAQPTNTAQASALEQLKGLVAQAGQTNQTASPAPKITLTPELASAIRDLAQQAQPTNTAQASALEQLKGLVAQAGQTNQTSPQVFSSDPKPALVVTTSTVGVAEKLSTPPLDSHSISKDQNSAIISSQNMKNSDNSLIPLYAGQASKENKGLEVAPRITPASDFHDKELEKIDELASQDLNSLSAQYSGLARLDSQTSEALQKFQIKQTEASFVSGPLHSEIMSAAKSGGGRIMFELTPPEQGTIRIDLQINQNGHAHLIVEGASDATKSRLDQGGQNLKQEFAQMGLNLSLDLRQGNQSQQASGQSFNNARQDYYASQQTTNPNPKNLATIDFIGSGHNTSASGTVHLFA